MTPPTVSRRTLLAGALSGATGLAAAGCSEGTGPAAPTGKGTAPTGSPTTPGNSGASNSSGATESATAEPDSASATSTPASAAQMAKRATVPVLCWHQLREWQATDGEYARNLLICPPQNFRAQLDALADDGWSTISPDQYLDHLSTGAKLPKKPVLLTFDDSQGSQMRVGLPELVDRDMTATFFAMTVVLGNPGWLTTRDIRKLDREGMTVGAHTWDHHRVDEYSGTDWKVQLKQPRTLLQDLTGKPVDHFAYPFGAWDDEALDHVDRAGYRSAYQLADRTPSKKSPQLTLRRELVVSTWTGPQMLDHITGLAP